jgi:hypothetical protein
LALPAGAYREAITGAAGLALLMIVTPLPVLTDPSTTRFPSAHRSE